MDALKKLLLKKEKSDNEDQPSFIHHHPPSTMVFFSSKMPDRRGAHILHWRNVDAQQRFRHGTDLVSQDSAAEVSRVLRNNYGMGPQFGIAKLFYVVL